MISIFLRIHKYDILFFLQVKCSPISAPFSVSTVNIWKFFEVVELLANMIKDLDIFFGNTYSQKSFVKLGRDASRVQNIGENLGERASASWATSIFGRASERELDDFKFLASERASSLTRSQARSRSRSRLARI